MALGTVYSLVMNRLGWAKGKSVGVRGSYAHEWTKDDKVRRVGLKTAWNRWLNMADAMLDRVDDVMVLAARWDDDGVPTHLDVYRVTSKDLKQMYLAIDMEKARCKAKGDMDFIPLDEEGLPYATAYCRIHGGMADNMTLQASYPIIVSEHMAAPSFVGHRTRSAPDTSGPKAATNEPLQGEHDIIKALKELYAKRNDTTIDKVRVQVLVEA